MKNNNRSSWLAPASGLILASIASFQAHAGLVTAAAAPVEVSASAPASAASAPVAADPQTMWLAVPEQAITMCVAGLCLGQSITHLPAESATLRGKRVVGQWIVVQGSKTALDKLQGINRVCERSDLPMGTDRVLQLEFKPLDGTAGGVVISAETVPRREAALASPFLVTAIELSTNAARADDARSWPASVEKLWPQLRPVLMDDASGATVVETWWMTGKSVPWPQQAGKGPSKLSHELRYAVDPQVSVDDPEFAARKWPKQIVKHSFNWAIGWSPMFAWEALRLQPECAPEQKAKEGEKTIDVKSAIEAPSR